MRCAACSGLETRGRSPRPICSGMPPTSPATVGRLPQRLGHGQPEALADRLLHQHVGLRLKGVDLDRADVVEVVEDLDVGIVLGVFVGVLEELPALGVVGGHRADQRQLQLGNLLGRDPVGVDHPHRVLPGVEAADLGQQRAVHVDPELVADVGGVVGRKRHVLRRQRVDRGRHDLDPAVAAEPGRHVLLHVPDAGVVLADQRLQALDRIGVGLREVDVAAPDQCLPRFLAPRMMPTSWGS